MYPCPDLDGYIFFDANVSQCPKESDVQSIGNGMFFYEVVEKIGKPHSEFTSNASITDGSAVFAWSTEEGAVYCIRFEPAGAIGNAQEMSMSEYHQYTVVTRIEQLDLSNTTPT